MARFHFIEERCKELVSSLIWRTLHGGFLMAFADVTVCVIMAQNRHNRWFVLHKTFILRLIISHADRLPHLTTIELETHEVKIKKRLRLRRYFDVSCLVFIMKIHAQHLLHFIIWLFHTKFTICNPLMRRESSWSCQKKIQLAVNFNCNPSYKFLDVRRDKCLNGRRGKKSPDC